MTTEDDGQQNAQTPAELREHVKRLEDKAKAADQLQRENAFLKAGVNLESKAGQLLFKAYDGELDIDALRNEAKELNALMAPATPAAPPEAPKAPEPTITPDELASTEMRDGIQHGEASADPKGKDTKTEALANSERILQEGGSRDDAVASYFADVAIAGYKEKDTSVIYRPQQ